MGQKSNSCCMFSLHCTVLPPESFLWCAFIRLDSCQTQCWPAIEECQVGQKNHSSWWRLVKCLMFSQCWYCLLTADLRKSWLHRFQSHWDPSSCCNEAYALAGILACLWRLTACPFCNSLYRRKTHSSTKPKMTMRLNKLDGAKLLTRFLHYKKIWERVAMWLLLAINFSY